MTSGAADPTGAVGDPGPPDRSRPEPDRLRNHPVVEARNHPPPCPPPQGGRVPDGSAGPSDAAPVLSLAKAGAVPVSSVATVGELSSVGQASWVGVPPSGGPDSAEANRRKPGLQLGGSFRSSLGGHTPRARRERRPFSEVGQASKPALALGDSIVAIHPPPCPPPQGGRVPDGSVGPSDAVPVSSVATVGELSSVGQASWVGVPPSGGPDSAEANRLKPGLQLGKDTDVPTRVAPLSGNRLKPGLQLRSFRSSLGGHTPGACSPRAGKLVLLRWGTLPSLSRDRRR
jgi:hypothetical protein